MKRKRRPLYEISWKRSEWIDKVELALGCAAIVWFEAKLADKNGRRRWARRWFSECDRELHRCFIHVYCHPLRRRFNQEEAFEQAVDQMQVTVRALREHVERKFRKAVPRARRALNGRDVSEFWMRARELASVMREVQEP